MDSPPTSRLRFWTPDGDPLDGPGEWQEAVMEVLVDASRWQDVEIRVQGTPAPVYLKVLREVPRALADWWRQGTGHYEVTVTCGGESCRQRLRVAPRKISESQFEALVSELSLRLPSAVALGLSPFAGQAGVAMLPPGESLLSQELAQVRLAVRGREGTHRRPGLVAVLREVSGCPHRILSPVGFWTPRDRARRPQASALAGAVARHGNVNAQREPFEVMDGRVIHSFDVYENRLLRLFAAQAELRLRRLVTAFDSTGNEAAGGEAREMLTDLLQARRAARFLDEVQFPQQPPAQPSMVFLRNPSYRAVLEGYLDFNRNVAAKLESEYLEAPLENLPDLYELWCTLQIIEGFLHAARAAGYTVASEQLTRRLPDGVLRVRVLPGGSPAVTVRDARSGAMARLVPQRQYSPSATGALHSSSYAKRPDVAVEITRPDGYCNVILFDPKYKLASEEDAGQTVAVRPVTGDIDAMHTYRDAIRDGQGVPVVSFAGIVYPGPEQKFPGGVGALSGVPGTAALRDAVIALLEPALKGAMRGVSAAPVRSS